MGTILNNLKAFFQENKKINLRSQYAFILFEICLFIHLASSLIGWDRKIDDFHSFRQCQTAISAYYTIHNGFHLAYETPVLGKPWAIPMEFPLYQWIVAGTVLLFHTPLDQTGRFWSLFFFYLSLIPIYQLLGYLIQEHRQKLLILCFILLAPTYLLWSRTFMIESLALFLGLSYLWAFGKLLSNRNRAPFFLTALLLGSLVGLVKVTTWVGFCLPCGWLMVRALVQKRSEAFTLKDLFQWWVQPILALVIPLLATLTWTHYTDHVKALNPMADDFLTSHSQTQVHWIFGSLAQRLSLSTWEHIIDNSHLLGLIGKANGGWCFLLLAAGWALPGRRVEKTICFACFLFPLLLFTNLYFVHDYYLYANGLFLFTFIGLALVPHFEAVPQKTLKLSLFLLIPLALSIGYGGYWVSYRIFAEIKTPTEEVSRMIRENTSPNDVLLIYGLDWDSTFPYYSQRRALMDRWYLPLDSPRMEKALATLGEDPIGGMLLSGRIDPGFILQRIKFFHLDPTPHTAGGMLFFSRVKN